MTEINTRPGAET